MAVSSKKYLGRRQVNVNLDDEHAILLSRVADTIGEGNRSAAVTILLDLYGGKIIERARQEADQEAKVALDEVVSWKVPKLSPELIAYVAGLVRAGNFPEIACDMAGIPPRLRSTWFKTGRKDRSDGNDKSLCAQLVAALTRAEAECEVEDIARLRNHGKSQWTAIGWRLERQYPDRYGQRKRNDVRVQHSVFPVIDWDRLDHQQTRTLVELLRLASPEIDEPGVSRMARPVGELIPADIIDGEAFDEDEAVLRAQGPATEAPALEQKPSG